ncbi:MAG: hypothetical protein ABRQ25_06440 [Clostridiaceae bacterium]
MNFRESVAYNKNLITGETIEAKKDKPEISAAKGVFTVQLFDAETGEKTYEAKSENRISAVFANSGYYTAYYASVIDAASDNPLYSACDAGVGFCNVLALTDGDITEDPYDYFIWGNLIGYADVRTVYSGSDSKRGTVNTIESTRTDNYANGGSCITSTTRHYVLDFATSAANGTFRSLYLTAMQGNVMYANAPMYNRMYKKKTLIGNITYTYLPFADSTNIYVANQTNATVYVYNKSNYAQGNNMTLPATPKSMCWDNVLNCPWLLASDGSFKKLNAADFTINTSYTKSASANVVDGTTFTATYIDICVAGSYVIITAYASSPSSKSWLVVYNKDGTFVKTISVASSANMLYATEIPNSKLLVKTYNGNIYMVYNISDLSVYSSTPAAGSYDSDDNFHFIRWDNDKKVMYAMAGSSSGGLWIMWVVPTGAHTLLASPVTKTPTNTMKIQYDVTVDYVYPLDMPPH